MAAGGVDVLRRKDSRFPRKDFGHKAQYGVSRNDDWDSRHNKAYGRIEDREFGRFSTSKDCEASRHKDNKAQLPYEKKRKFSPIVWEGKDVRVSYNKRVAAITPPSSDAVLDVDVSEVTLLQPEPLTVEAGVAEELLEAARSKNLTDLSPDLVHLKSGDFQFQQIGDVLQEGAQERTISMSRWASGNDSPQHMSDGVCTPDMGRVSSPESGEFQREGSSGDRARVSRSDDEGRYTGSGSGGKGSVRDLSDGCYMDSDGENGEDAGANCCFDSEDDGEDCQIEKPTESTHQQADMIPTCRNVFEYERLNKINEGTYGVVYKARDKKTGEIVALKKVKMDVRKDDGFPLTSLREINILSSFSHPSIVEVKEVVMDDFDGVYMVMEYMEHDLKALMEKMKGPFSIGEVKWLMLQLLEGVKYLHDNWVLHRDLKTSNLLLSKEGILKICDFGLSRQYGSPRKPYTPLVVTLWYRAPELLLGTKEYSTAIDMWSVGCIMAELVAKSPLFTGKTEVEQLDKIFRTLGTPNETIWPGFSKLPGSKANFVKKQFNSLRQKFPPTSFIGSPVLSDLGFDLLSRLLTYDPEKRITAEDALNHKWFVEAPVPRSDFRPSLPVVQGQNRYLSSWE